MGIKLNNDIWTLGEEIGSGGFGKVYRATNSQNKVGALKFVPKAHGATRDLLVADLIGVENIIPIIDQGETEDDWLIAMPLAEKSFADFLEERKGKVDLAEVVKLAKDITTSLKGLDGRIVHRDIKPQNILLLDGQWCLTDFGISRYAEATTAPDTQKYSLSPPYAAPERWRNIRASSSTDIYSLGVLMFQAITGDLPFNGPSIEDFREQHINSDPPRLENVTSRFADLIQECMYKSMGSRPSAVSFLERIDTSLEKATSSGLGALQDANRQRVELQSVSEREATVKDEELKERAELSASARQEFNRIMDRLKKAILDNAPTAQIVQSRGQEWRIVLGDAQLDLNDFTPHYKDDWGDRGSPAMDVAAFASIDVSMTPNRLGYEGRGHSLWYCDAKTRGEYGWYEVSFMISVFLQRRMGGSKGGTRDPFQLNPGREASTALSTTMGEFDLARPFVLLKDGEVDEFIDRWAGYLASASSGFLNSPSSMPEIPPHGSWTR